MVIRRKIREMFWKAGYDVRRVDPKSSPVLRLKRIFEMFQIDLVIDVGANTGQFGNHIRNVIGFAGELVSIEPQQSAFKTLERRASNDPKWRVLNVALGKKNGKCKLHVSQNSESSSFLPILPIHITAAPESKYVGWQQVEMMTLDALCGKICKRSDHIYLKIDTQGYEMNILKGANHCLEWIDTIQLEMSLVPLYRGESLFQGMHNFLAERRFSLVSIDPVYFDQGLGPVYQVDGIFHRYRGDSSRNGRS